MDIKGTKQIRELVGREEIRGSKQDGLGWTIEEE